MSAPGWQPPGYLGPVGGAVFPDGTPLPADAAVSPIQGTPYGVALLRSPRLVSGPSLGSLVVGIASVLVGMVTGCFGLLSGPAVAGAFAILTGASAVGSLLLGGLGIRQIRRGREQTTGMVMAIIGMTCGGIGLCSAVLAMAVALATSADL